MVLCCAAEDQPLADELRRHLQPLVCDGTLAIWGASDVPPGADLEAEMARRMDAAQLILLLISADALASMEFLGQMSRAMALSEAARARCLPVLVRDALWQQTALGRLQPLPVDGIPVIRWSNRDQAWVAVAAAIRVAALGPPLARQPGARTPDRWVLDPHLPAQPDLFFGRAADLQQIKRRLGVAVDSGDPDLRTHVLTAVRGMAGMGKTTLAAWLAHDPDIRAVFPDGVLWTSCGPSPQISSELARWGLVLGSHQLFREPVLSRLTAQLAELCGPRRLLAIVDDVCAEEHAVPFLRALGAHGVLLVTTREPAVAHGLAATPEAHYDLPALAPGPALDLLRCLAPAAVALHEEACADLLARLGWLPLAVRVAGRLLHAEAALGCALGDLLRELAQGDALLHAKVPTDLISLDGLATPTVASVLRRSTDRLPQAVRDRFACLGVLPPKPASCSLSNLAALWEVDDALPTVRTLVDRGLLEPAGGGRFQVHVMVAALARALLG